MILVGRWCPQPSHRCYQSQQQTLLPFALYSRRRPPLAPKRSVSALGLRDVPALPEIKVQILDVSIVNEDDVTKTYCRKWPWERSIFAQFFFLVLLRFRRASPNQAYWFSNVSPFSSRMVQEFAFFKATALPFFALAI